MTPAKITAAKHSITKTHLGIFQMWVFDFGVFENIVNIKHYHPIIFDFRYILYYLEFNPLCFEKLRYRFLKIPPQAILCFAGS